MTDAPTPTWCHGTVAERADLRGADTENLHVEEQSWVCRRGSSVVAINHGVEPVEIRLPALEIGADALGLCPAASGTG